MSNFLIYARKITLVVGGFGLGYTTALIVVLWRQTGIFDSQILILGLLGASPAIILGFRR